MTATPRGLQLDLATAITRIQEIAAAVDQDGRLSPMGHWLLTDRLLTCDVPRLRGHLSPDTENWLSEEAGGLAGPPPGARHGRPPVDAQPRPPRRRWLRSVQAGGHR